MQRAGQVHIAMHWGPEFVGKNAVNFLTNDAACPQSKQPELKFSAVKLESLTLEHHLVVLVWCAPGQAQAMRRQLSQSFANADYCYASLFSYGSLAEQSLPSIQEGVLLQVASQTPIGLHEIDRVEHQLGIAAKALLRYEDSVNATTRRVAIENNQIRYLMIQGDARAEQWLRPLLQERADIEQIRSLLLAPTPPQFAATQADPVVCQCHGVRAGQINQFLDNQFSDNQLGDQSTQPLAQLKIALRCGTECGSCVPQLQRMIQQAQELIHVE